MITELELLKQDILALRNEFYELDSLKEKGYEVMEDTDWYHNYKCYWLRNFVIKTPSSNFYQVQVGREGRLGDCMMEYLDDIHIVEVVPHVISKTTYVAKKMDQNQINQKLLKYQAIAAFSQPKGQAEFQDFIIAWDNGWHSDFERKNTEWRFMGISDKSTGNYAYTIATRRDRKDEDCPWVLNCNFTIEKGCI